MNAYDYAPSVKKLRQKTDEMKAKKDEKAEERRERVRKWKEILNEQAQF